MTAPLIFRNLTANGDWTFGQGLGNYVNQNAAVGLNIKTRLLSWVGDCFFDLGAGIDWLNRLSLKNQQVLLQNDLRRVILQTYGVTGIVTFNAKLTGRNFTANYQVNTIYSSITDSVGVKI